MPDPEALAREEIDRQLTLAGWIVQDREEIHLVAGPGIAIREVLIPGASKADYLLITTIQRFYSILSGDEVKTGTSVINQMGRRLNRT